MKCVYHNCENEGNPRFCSHKCENKFSVGLCRKKVKKMAVEYLGGKCSRCGYNKCHAALDFHHNDPNEKEFAISKTGHTLSWERIKKEIDKCTLLCANCHREEHYVKRQEKIDQRIKNNPPKPWGKKEYKKCLICSNKTKNKDYCSYKCRAIADRKVEWPSKEVLEEEIWKLPCRQLAIKYGVSDKAIERWCKRFNINKPPRGYWSKIFGIGITAH